MRVPFFVLSLTVLAGAAAAQAPVITASPAVAASPACEWTGSPTLAELRVQSPPPVHISLVALAGRRSVVSLIAIGLFEVHTVDDGAPLLGTTREPIAIAISGAQTFAGVATVASGALVEGLRPRRPGLRGDIAIADGVLLERVTLPCEALGLASEVSSLAMVGPVAPGPRWLARVRTFRMRARPEPEAPRLTLRIEDRSRHVFIERERRESWVRVEAIFPHATLSGWVLDSDLSPAR